MGIRAKNFRGISLLNLTAISAVILFTSIVYVFGNSLMSDEGGAGGNPAVPPGAVTAGPEEDGGWQSVQMRVTAYCPCGKCCGKYSDGMTACGHRIRQPDAFVAADGMYSFGTEVIVPGYNNSEPVKVLDRGSAIRGNRLDVFFGSHEDALRWGVKYLEVKVRVR